MKYTNCYSLAPLGYKDEYVITEQGLIIDTASQSQLQKDSHNRYSLKTNNGQTVKRRIKPLYRAIFNKEFAEDTIEDLPEEIWKPIDQKGKYFISSLGRVKSYQQTQARLLKPYKNQCGYYRVDIMLDKRRTYLVHQLVAVAFVYNDDPEKKDTIDHINRNKRDNTANNLRWLSREDNIKAYYNALEQEITR